VPALRCATVTADEFPVRPALLLLALALACAAPAPTPAPIVLTPPAPTPHDACRDDLSGLWRQAGEDGFRYQATDDGGVLLLEARRDPGDGGAVSSASLFLQRSLGGFVGAVGAPRLSADGGCVALFPAEVVSCADGGLVLATVDRMRVDAACRPVAPGARTLHRLERVVSDAGP
jgi:hypothetical protein